MASCGKVPRQRNERRYWGTYLGLALVVSLGIGVSPGVWAGQNVWTSNGPYGADEIAVLAADPVTPGTLYAGTAKGGLFKTTDGGCTWEDASNGLPHPVKFHFLAVDPVTPTTIYAEVNALYALYRSTDGGASWLEITGDFPGGAYLLAIGPLTPSTSVIYTLWGTDFWRSTDCGDSWTATPAPDDVSILTLAVHPFTASTLYAGYTDDYGRYGGVLKSIDAGVTWVPVNNGLPSAPYNVLAIDPHAPETLFAISNYAYHGVFKSSNGGVSWTEADNGIPAGPGLAVGDIQFDPIAPSTLYAARGYVDVGSRGGVLKSTDEGASWAVVGDDPSGFRYPIHTLVAGEGAQGTLYSGTVGGLFKSTDGGATWTTAHPAVSPVQIVPLLADPLVPGTLYAGSQGYGLFKSTDGGMTWAAANHGLTESYVMALALDPLTQGVFYAGTWGGGSLQERGRSMHLVSREQWVAACFRAVH